MFNINTSPPPPHPLGVLDKIVAPLSPVKSPIDGWYILKTPQIQAIYYVGAASLSYWIKVCMLFSNLALKFVQ